MMVHLANQTSTSTLSEFEPGQVQPNAIDLKLDKVFRIEPKPFRISEDEKVHRGSVAIEPDEDGFFQLMNGVYEIIMDGVISIGPDEAGWVITRSTLNRNGLFITSGLYDSGYEGVMAGALHVNCGPAKIKKGTRVGQFLLFKSEALSSYSGDYGVSGTHDNKYGTLN